MKHLSLRNLLFLTLCCDLGLFSKRLIAPAANILTDFLRIPGGIGTSFSLMFLVVAAELVPIFGCATLMSVIQSMIALSLGMVGSMGILSPIGYIVPGIVIDLIYLTLTIANMLGAAAASLTANLIVFHLPGVPLALYIVVALASGAVCGSFAGALAKRLRPVVSASNTSDFEERGISAANHAPRN